MKYISSVQNETVKSLIQLKAKSKSRKQSKRFIIEGQRELTLAIESGYEIHRIFYVAELCNITELQSKLPNVEFVEITKVVFSKLAHRNTTEGIIAEAIGKSFELTNLKFTTKNPLILVAEAPEKPGNIGALLRTADAANVDAVIIANPKTDMYNPNIIRSSVGTVFTNQIATGSTTEVINFLTTNTIAIYCAALEAATNYTLANFKTATAIVVGTEATGLNKEWLYASKQNIVIPMEGRIDSMNVSVAAGILIFEAKRQRNF